MPMVNWTSMSSELERAIHLTVGHSDPMGYPDADSTVLPELEQLRRWMMETGCAQRRATAPD
jgi:hypothetical protein